MIRALRGRRRGRLCSLSYVTTSQSHIKLNTHPRGQGMTLDPRLQHHRGDCGVWRGQVCRVCALSEHTVKLVASLSRLRF